MVKNFNHECLLIVSYNFFILLTEFKLTLSLITQKIYYLDILRKNIKELKLLIFFIYFINKFKLENL